MRRPLLIGLILAIFAGCRPYRPWAPAYEGVLLTQDAMSLAVAGVRVKVDFEEVSIDIGGGEPITSSRMASIVIENALDVAVLYDVTQIELRYSGSRWPATGVSARRSFLVGGQERIVDTLRVESGKKRTLRVYFESDLFRAVWDEPVVVYLGEYVAGARTVKMPAVGFLPSDKPKTF